MRLIRAGALRSPVYIGRPVIVKDASGGEVLTFEEFKTFALIEPLSGREWASGAAVKDTIDHRISLRLTNGWIPDARWRVRDAVSGTLFNLVAVMLAGKNGAAECLAKRAPGNSDGR